MIDALAYSAFKCLSPGKHTITSHARFTVPKIYLPFQGDFFAIEMFEGFLYLHLDLGSGALRLRASNGRLDDGNWHKIDLVRNRRTGTLRLDEESHDFETPG
jgi:leucine-rich repeat transmembrane neuronal protein 1/2